MTPFIEMLRQFWDSLQQGQVLPLGNWSYLLLMVLIIIQGPISTMLGGAAAAAGLLNPIAVLVVAMFGNLGADAFWYSMGYTSRIVWTRPFLRRYHELVVSLQSEMQRHALKVLLLAKLSVGMAVPAMIAAGFAQVPWRKWFLIVILGEFVWTGSLLLTGYYATDSIIGSRWTIVQLGEFVSVILIVAAGLYVWRMLRRQRAD